MLVGQETDEVDENVYVMSPFEVSSSSNTGYSSTETLGGTRIRTDLSDIASSISVINSQFLKDTGATGSQDLLVYTTNTEVGGVSGNFSGMGGGQTYNENSKLLRPNENTRVRGLDSADNTQNYFLTEAPWDSYNVDRVEMQRGANSILFGVGSPAGIVNTSTKSATFQNEGSVEARVDSNGGIRGSIDVNRVLLDDELSLRVLGLYDHTKFEQDPAFEKDKRIYTAVRYEPRLFGDSAHTTIRASFEIGDIEANRPRSLPPIDRISPWFWTGTVDGVEALNKRTINPLDTYDYYINNSKWQNSANSATVYPWFAGGATIGSIGFSNPAQYFNQVGSNPSTPVISRSGGTVPTNSGLNSSGQIDAIINGIDNFTRSGIAGYHDYASKAFAGGAYYSDYSLSDPSVFDFYNNLIDGNNKKEWQKWDTGNISIAQTFLDNRLGFEAASFYQNYEEGKYSILDGSTYAISIDPYTYTLDGQVNPFAGAPYVGGSGSSSNYANYIDRNTSRLTAFADLRSTDFLEESWITRILGHHLLTVLASNDVRKTDNRNFYRWAFDEDYPAALGASTTYAAGYRDYNWIAYLGPSLTGSQYTSAQGLNLSSIVGTISPGDSATVRYFDSTWTGAASGATSWGDPYTYYTHDYTNVHEWPGAITENTSTQSENPANYIGWTNSEFNVLSAENGDINELYSSITKEETTISSVGITLQSYMLDDCLVYTYGWRRDRVKNYSGSAPERADTNADYTWDLTDDNGKAQYTAGNSHTWGVVLHSPDFVNRSLPLGMKVSAFYGRGENFKADAPRGDVYGNQIDNQRGKTKDYGFVISALDNRISLKTTWYETKVANANLYGEGVNGLNYWIWAVPNWGSTYALAALDGLHDPQMRQGNWGWPWAAMVNYSSDYIQNGVPNQAAKEMIFGIVKDWFTNIDTAIDSQFVEEYGMSIDLAAMRQAGLNGDVNDQSTWDAFYNAIPVYGLNESGVYDPISGKGASSLGEIGQTLYGSTGSLKSYPRGATATSDTVSKGIEWELNARLTDNWNLLLNVSKTEATIDSVSPTITEAVDKMTAFLDTNAGNLPLWGSDNLRSIWEAEILRPYNTMMAKIGASASEVSPWRFNLITNYNFSEGTLKGLNVGAAYRWEDKRVLGYEYDATVDALDITKPWYGPTEDHIDLWVGYTTKVTDTVNWRVQLNLRNVGEDSHLVPVYIQPDGSTGYSRIADGMAWFLTNTIEF